MYPGSSVSFSELAGLFEARPAGSKSFHIRGEVKEYRTGLFEWVYYVSDKNLFYIQYDLLSSSTLHYYGPFKGDPRKVLKDIRLMENVAFVMKGGEVIKEIGSK